MVARHIETGNRSQINDLIKLWVEVGIGLGLVLARFDFLPCHKTQPSADYEPMLDVNGVAEWHGIFSARVLTLLPSFGRNNFTLCPRLVAPSTQTILRGQAV